MAFSKNYVGLEKILEPFQILTKKNLSFFEKHSFSVKFIIFLTDNGFVDLT